jgi:Delta3-Delta2-enoyl-CoA isomerase
MLRRSFVFRGSSSTSSSAAKSSSDLPKVKGLEITRAPCNPRVVNIILNRPRQKNAITYEMYLGIRDALKNFSKNDSVGAIVLTGAPECNMYCSGNDLKNFFQFSTPRKLSHDAKIICREFVDSFIECEKPIVVGCNGPAIGIAVTTLALCDHRVCTEDTTFVTPFKALAQGPEGCSSYLFPKILGNELAHKMIDLGYTMKSDEALKHKFVHEIVPRPKLLQHCQFYAADILEGRIKFDGRESLKEKEKLKKVNWEECDYLEEAWVSVDCFKALEKFMTEKKQPIPAAVFGMLNKTRFLWDKKNNTFRNKEVFIPLEKK